MTHRESILDHLLKHPGLCDDCLAGQLGIQRRQRVNTLCRELQEQLSREPGECASCAKLKKINALGASAVPALNAATKPGQKKSRSQDLRTLLNEALISVFPLEQRDYYAELSFAQLLQLKRGLARIHDTVTLKITLELVHWVAARFQLTPDQKAALWKQVEDQSANASGFDLQWNEPQIIAEVKGCIPVNGGSVFGAAQLRSLTNDVRQMLGLAAHGKDEKDLSPRTKVRPAANRSAIKLLALYDSPEVRKATIQWRRSVEAQAWFKELDPPMQIQDAPAEGSLNDPSKVYLVYLTPKHEKDLATKVEVHL